MARNDLMQDSYSKRELLLDSMVFFNFNGAQLLARTVAPLDPVAVGLMLSAGVNVASVQISSKMCQKFGVNSRLLKVCALISALAISTFVLPWILSASSAQMFAVLSLETAIESTLMHLVLKTASYVGFQTWLQVKGRLGIVLPTSAENVKEISNEDLAKVHQHLIDFPSKAQYIPLPVHLELSERYKDAGLKNLPLTGFSEMGGMRVTSQLKALHKLDSSKLPLSQKKELNELFLTQSFPPQERSYSRYELDQLDLEAIAKQGTKQKTEWAHLILRTSPKTPIPNALPKRFYKQGLPPARDEWILLKSLSSIKAVRALEEYQVGWYQNLYANQPKEWSILSSEVQSALQSRFKELPVYSPFRSLPLKGRVAKRLPWNLEWNQATKTAVGLSLLGSGALVSIRAFFSRDIEGDSCPPMDDSISTWTTSNGTAVVFGIATVSIAAVCVTSYLYYAHWKRIAAKEKDLTEPDIDLFEGSPDHFSDDPPGIDLAEGNSANDLKKNETGKPLSDTQYNSESPLQDRDETLSQSNDEEPYKDDGIGILPNNEFNLIAQDVSLEIDQPLRHNENVVVPSHTDDNILHAEDRSTESFEDLSVHDNTQLQPNLNNVQGNIQAGDRSTESSEDLPVNNNTQLQLNPNNVQGNIQVEDLFSESSDDSNPTITNSPQNNNQTDYWAGSNPSSKEKKDLFRDYCKKYNVEYDRQTAWEDAKEGIVLIQEILEGARRTIKATDEDVRKIAWGLMKLEIDKSYGYEEGTIVFEDPNYDLFYAITSHPNARARGSTHYEEDVIPIAKGRLQGSGHVGIRIENLPPNMEALVMGRINRGSEKKFYIKFEPYAWNAYDFSFQGLNHNLGHAKTTIQSQIRRQLGTNSSEGSRKEHFPEKDIQKCLDFVRKIKSFVIRWSYPLSQVPDQQERERIGLWCDRPMLKSGGLTTFRNFYEKWYPCLKAFANRDQEIGDLINEIDAYLKNLQESYEDFDGRKGQEGFNSPDHVKKYTHEELARSTNPQTPKPNDPPPQKSYSIYDNLSNPSEYLNNAFGYIPSLSSYLTGRDVQKNIPDTNNIGSNFN